MNYFPIFSFILGTIVGSFSNVVALRHIVSQRPTGRSKCPKCGLALRWWQLIPLLSFVFLHGRCWHCQAPISVQYPLVELSMGLLTMLLFWPLPTTTLDLISIAAKMGIAAILIILFIIDLRTFILPDRFVVILLWLVMIELAVELSQIHGSYLERLMSSLQGISIGAGFLLFLWIVTRGRGIGLGDVKLLIPLGALFAVQGTITVLFIAFTVGGIFGLYLLARQQASLKTPLPFGPFLSGAAILVLVMPDLPLYLFSTYFHFY